MPAYEWYATQVNSAGTATVASTLVTVFVGTVNPGGYDIFILDINADGLVNQIEWRLHTGGGLGLNGGTSLTLFDGAPGGSGIIYSATSYLPGATGLKAGLTNTFNVDPQALDPSPPPCFRTGTRIATPSGPVAVESLRAGDAVCLFDGGSAEIYWTGAVTLSADHLRQRPRLRPVCIPIGALAPEVPARSLVVSPQHRVLLRSASVAAIAGTDEVLIAAHRLVGWCGIRRMGTAKPVTYHHILLARHAVVISENAPTESLYLGPMAWRMLPLDARRALAMKLPDLVSQRPEPARLMADGPIARAILRQIGEMGSGLLV